MDDYETNKNVVRKYNECLNNSDDECLFETLDDGYVLHTFRDTVRGRNGLAKVLKEIKAGFPDIRMEIVDQVADGNTVVNRLSVTGTHEGEFNGIPATHKRVHTTGLAMFHLDDGRIVDQWSEINIARLLGQIGALPLNEREIS